MTGHRHGGGLPRRRPSRFLCAAAGAQVILSKLWPCASGLTSCAGANPGRRGRAVYLPAVDQHRSGNGRYRLHNPCNSTDVGSGAVPVLGAVNTTSAATSSQNADPGHRL